MLTQKEWNAAKLKLLGNIAVSFRQQGKNDEADKVDERINQLAKEFECV